MSAALSTRLESSVLDGDLSLNFIVEVLFHSRHELDPQQTHADDIEDECNNEQALQG